ncbi:MAG: Sir2 silent information regulator family NAD-dependent deacetylase [Lachnospiraceae bacterium]|nr:Sir2 silent information regulator family NAD-dependent deacetylase [Lachnospiraceae bacterium]
MFSKSLTKKSTEDCFRQIDRLGEALSQADAVLIGAGSGLSASAGFTYSGERFQKYFGDFAEKYGIRDMYSGGFYPYSSLEEYWAWWSRHIYYNRYVEIPKPTYQNLLEIVKDKDYFVLTTNVDHCFQKAGFDKKRLFYTQGDYGLWQCSDPCHQKTYDNEEAVLRMLREQNDMRIPSELIPRCPVCGKPMTMNLRCDHTFVQDEGWYAAQNRYSDFLRRHAGLRTLYLELGVGANTPGIIKYPFWQMTAENPRAVYACVNYGEAYAPGEIQKRSICINRDIEQILEKI